MKLIIAISFLLAFAVQTFSGALIVADYFTNTAAYAKNCENKAKPLLHCNGKCQMRKQLQQEQKDQQSPERKAENKNEHVIASQSFFTSVSSLLVAQTPAFYTCFACGRELKMPRSIFHPPGA